MPDRSSPHHLAARERFAAFAWAAQNCVSVDYARTEVQVSLALSSHGCDLLTATRTFGLGDGQGAIRATAAALVALRAQVHVALAGAQGAHAATDERCGEGCS